MERKPKSMWQTVSPCVCSYRRQTAPNNSSVCVSMKMPTTMVNEDEAPQRRGLLHTLTRVYATNRRHLCHGVVQIRSSTLGGASVDLPRRHLSQHSSQRNNIHGRTAGNSSRTIYGWIACQLQVGTLLGRHWDAVVTRFDFKSETGILVFCKT